MEPIVEMRNVTAWRGSTRVFENLTVELHRGENTAILGPNGSGKTTFLRLLSREIYPEHREASTMRLFGRERWNVWELRGRMGIVSHDLQTAYPRQATGGDVVLSGFRSSMGTWAHQRFNARERTRVGAILKELGIQALAEKRYDAMSTGEQRRFLLGRALVHDPEVLILDEPTSGLDPGACFQYLDLVQSLMHAGKTLVLVTHHLHEIPPQIERTILLKEGQVVADGTTAEVLTSPRLTHAFGTPIQVVQASGFYHAFPPGRKTTPGGEPTDEGDLRPQRPIQ
jgi:iron complex transport system ATP-binding protein